jgi:hypothetical protein
MERRFIPRSSRRVVMAAVEYWRCMGVSMRSAAREHRCSHQAISQRVIKTEGHQLMLYRPRTEQMFDASH